jgi:2,3-bisphosphoglycerate-dependent phosphoglycerate mutase
MKKFLTVLFVLSIQLILAQEATTYYLIRHAEKDRSDPSNSNPELTLEGRQRSQRWSAVFERIALDAVYSTNYLRTIQTASPTAEAHHIAIQFYDPRALYSEEFKASTTGQNVLIVGHSNTIPELANAILGEQQFENIPDDINSYLYVITVIDNYANSILFTID